MHILLSNDDGIVAPGLAAMYRALQTLGTVTVAAPDSVQSASGHAITVGRPLRARWIHVHNEFYGWSVDGRPADCVKLAVRELVESKPDLVVAGINDGANVSINVLYSGTVAAAAEGALLGIPAIAVSLARGEETDFDRAAAVVRPVIDRLLAFGLALGQLINVNVPTLSPGRPLGVRTAVQATQTMEDRYARREDPGGGCEYYLEGDFAEPAGEHETDLHALTAGHVVVTPLQVDLTDRTLLARLEEIDWPDPD